MIYTDIAHLLHMMMHTHCGIPAGQKSPTSPRVSLPPPPIAIAPMASFAAPDLPVLGYHKIRGLAAPLRMMFYYKKASFINTAYGADMKETWFGADKPQLLENNSCMNLPYIVDGPIVVTQSNSCAVYLGKKLGIDSGELGAFAHNHTVLDQTMDLRNDLMKVVYPFGAVKTPDQFPAAAKDHLDGSAAGTFGKLEGFVLGTFMGGAAPQSGDFMLFEMIDQHMAIAAAVGAPAFFDAYPKLKKFHATMKALPALAPYFASAPYASWAQNNGLFTHFTGQPASFDYGPSVSETITF